MRGIEIEDTDIEPGSHSWNARPGHRKPPMKTALVKRLERLEIVPGFQESNHRFKIEFKYLKQLPREYTGPRHIVTVGRRPDGREECE